MAFPDKHKVTGIIQLKLDKQPRKSEHLSHKTKQWDKGSGKKIGILSPNSQTVACKIFRRS